MLQHMRLWPNAGTVFPAFWLNNGWNGASDMTFMTDSTSLCDDGARRCVIIFYCYLYEDLVPT
jgi:hypothetical protein